MSSSPRHSGDFCGLEHKVYDCFLYNGEIDALEIRLHELADVAYRFVVLESDKTFRGTSKALSFDPLDPRITPFAAAIRYVLVKDMPHTNDACRRQTWQRNAILRGIPDAAEDDLVLVSNVDEIPRATTVQDLASCNENSIFGLQLASYSTSTTRTWLNLIRQPSGVLRPGGRSLRGSCRTTCGVMSAMVTFRHTQFQVGAGTFPR
jgi:hypothetical protein